MATTVDNGAAFLAYLGEKRSLVDGYLMSHLPEPLPGETSGQDDMRRYLYDPFAAYTANGGKRTRPVLALLGSEAVGGHAEDALAVACAIEDFQSAALIHDDIADEGELRRGKPCLHRTEGVGVAINVGDLALVTVTAKVLRAEGLSDEKRLRVLDELVAMEERTLEGQALDLGWARDGRWDVTAADYLVMARHKTAFYSAATPLAVGAICGGGTSAQVEALRSFGMWAGLAFQLQDDLLNLVGNEAAQGKDFRTDITEGKRTLAVCDALERLDSERREELVAILSSHTSDASALARAVELMESAGAIERVRDYALSLVNTAKQQLKGIDLVGDSRAILESMADFFVERRG